VNAVLDLRLAPLSAVGDRADALGERVYKTAASDSADCAFDLMEASFSAVERLSRARFQRAAAGGLRPLTASRLRKFWFP